MLTGRVDSRPASGRRAGRARVRIPATTRAGCRSRGTPQPLGVQLEYLYLKAPGERQAWQAVKSHRAVITGSYGGQFRGFATGYDKLSTRYQAGIHLISTIIWLRTL